MPMVQMADGGPLKCLLSTPSFPHSSSSSSSSSSMISVCKSEEPMANPTPSAPPEPLYPEVLQSNPDSDSPFLSTSATPPSTSLYPSVENLFPDSPKSSTAPVEETLLSVPGAILHLIDKRRSVELSTGTLTLLRLRQGPSLVALLARLSSSSSPHNDPDVQWPLTRDTAAVKLDHSHYFFSLLSVPDDSVSDDSGPLNYGLTFASKGQESALKELDGILEAYCSFSMQKVNRKEASEVIDGSVAEEVTPAQVMEAGPQREMMEERSAAYWTALAPNVEDYSGLVAKGIALGSGQLVKGILWCGDVAVERIRWGDELLRKRMGPNDKPAEISKETLERIKRVKKVTKMSEKVATGILTGVVRVSGYFTSSVVNSRAGKKFISLLPGEVVLASLEGFGKICDAVEMAGKNVLSTSSVVTTGLVSHRYGEEAAEATTEGLDAAGHAIGTAWTVFKIRKAIDPKSSLKSAAKAAAEELKVKKGK